MLNSVKVWAVSVVSICAVCASGCSPASMAVKVGMHVAGKVIADEQVSEIAASLIGERPSAADAQLGAPVDTWREVNGGREWRAYPVKMDVLGTKRYVVGIAGGRIADVQMVEKSLSETDIPLALVYFAKVKGKSPRECESVLGFGPPLVTARSQSTNQLVQIYDARLIKELPEPHNCLVWFDVSDRCNKLDLLKVPASSDGGP